jgi:predicted nucleotidyltransferase
MTHQLASRRSFSTTKTSSLLARLDEAKRLSAGKCCIYATGSYGRREAGEHSDIDIYIVGRVKEQNGVPTAELSNLDEICIKADLIHGVKSIGLPRFDGDGRYLVHYPISQLTGKIGKQDDDYNNTFSARLLLLLESRALIGNDIHSECIDRIISSYWRDYEDHKSDFLPAFFINDILRLWRTFCVNYEANTGSETDYAKSKRKLKNYKLKHSRILTCYSAILMMLAIYNRHHAVSPDDVRNICRETPTERLQFLAQQADLASARSTLESLLEKYEQFLEVTDHAEEYLVDQIQKRKLGEDFLEKSYEFGEIMFKAVHEIGQGSKLHRIVVV